MSPTRLPWLARAFVLLIAPLGAGCGPGGSTPTGTGDEVTGGGRLVYSDLGVDIEADVRIHAVALDPGTTAADGLFSLQQAVGWWKGQVTSLVLEGSSIAIAGGVITEASDASDVGHGFYEIVFDGAGASVPDRSQTIFMPPGDPGPWVGPVDIPIFVMVSGDYAVVDR